MRNCTVLFLAMLVVLPVPAAKAQFADASQWKNGNTPISAPWRFHTGDNPQWASPNFDDSRWPLLRVDRGRSEQGYRDYAGYAWYRIELKLPDTKEPLALGLDRVASSEEIYVDGQLLATLGQMRPEPVWRGHVAATDVVPLPASVNGRTVEVTRRIWESQIDASATGAGAAPLPRLGTLRATQSEHILTAYRSFVAMEAGWLVDVVAAVIGLFSLGLFVLRPRATEYAWAALWLGGGMLTDGLLVFRQTHQLQIPHWTLASVSLQSCLLVCWLFLVWGFVGAKPDRLLATGIALAFVSPVAAWLATEHLIPVAGSYVTRAVQLLLLGILIFVRLVQLALRGNRNAQMFLLPFLLTSVVRAIDQVRGALFYVGALGSQNGLVFYHAAAVDITWGNVFGLLSSLAVAAVLVLRFTRSAQEEQRLTTEIESARQVQALLVPTQLPITPHFHFDAAYFAANVVGGDFYQVMPQIDGGLLVMVGDVSGKGLRAAMVGTLIVGAFRALAQEERSPAKILMRLNRQLMVSSSDGFVTCLVLHLTPEGQGLIANAGHLAPYRNGEETACDGGLPLGLAAKSEYTETVLQLAPGDMLTLLSDGVVEARNSAGELFGFDRTRTISSLPADEIARAAQQFGQEDDITVIAVIRTGVLEPETA